MEIMKLSSEYINVGCNKTPQVAAWAKDGLVAFGAHNYVALYYPEDPNSRGIIATLTGHKGRVNCVNFINRGDEFNQTNIAIISGSTDKTARIWKKTQNEKWINSAILDSHEGSVNTIGVIQAKSIIVEKDLIVTGSSDGIVKVWERIIIDDVKDTVTCIQTINLESKYPMGLALSYLPESKVPILAIGGTDKKIFLYIQKNGQFIKSLSLQGHENWIRSLSFATYVSPSQISMSTIMNDDDESSTTKIKQQYKLNDGDLLLASASQDKYARLWRISYNYNDDDDKSNKEEKNIEKNVDKGKLNLKELLQGLQDNNNISSKKVQLSTKAHIIEIDDQNNTKKNYSVMFEALLMGHDDGVYSVCWHPPLIIKDENDNFKYHQPMSILTSSSDKSMIIWKPELETGVWVNLVRVGEIGGNTLGFYGGLFGPKGNYIIAHGHTGAFHLWKNVNYDNINNNNNEDYNQNWQPQVSISGHFNSVLDISWNPTFKYLVSVSLDQTARLFSTWNRQIDYSNENNKNNTENIITTWHEIGRPQIHGFDIHCLSFVDQWKYVSGSDEKIVRVFDAPKNFVKSLANITRENDNNNNNNSLEELGSRPVGANLPPLGLSNKAIFNSDIENSMESYQEEEFLDRKIPGHTSLSTLNTLKILDKPPLEEQLSQSTLWPEVEQSYGHGYEIISVGASHDGKYVASACKATTAEHAIIRLYNTKTWKEFSNGTLESHSLTVTKIRFSHNDKWILSVSRDRLWSLFERTDDEVTPYKLIAKNKSHARIIWDSSWSHDDLLFATASRDKTIKIWKQEDKINNWKCITTIKLSEAVTAIDFAPKFIGKERYFMAAGLENGKILFFISEIEQIDKWSLVMDVDKDNCHVASVNRLVLSEFSNSTENNKIKLRCVSCGSDYCIKILNLEI
ncbi:hypothetical protein Glove_306g48 [Diversispora epigaea]|uniref:Elongator complex protein 2 n=1 Tax=Diversispora epigaea TaxID=1348612 RepID=A0A397HYF6_9GLOM|nr:hypothetical protein Glove_306g48 [Diversispora epigaea]